MFGKLLKYDFRSMWKQFAFIWPAALALALVNHFTLNSFVTSASNTRQTVSGVAMLVYVAILMAMFIVALVFTIQRFFKGLLGDEGYLMHTLPVKSRLLIASKLLAAVAATALSILVAILSILVVAPIQWGHIGDMFRGLGYLFTHWNIHMTQGVLLLLELLLFICVGMAQGYLQLYLAMAIGQLFNKNRIAMSVVAYIAVNAAMSVLLGVLGSMNFHPLQALGELLVNTSSLSGQGAAHLALWIGIIWTGALGALYFFGTEYILRKKLNLE